MGAHAVSFEYKGIAEGKYTEGIIEALDRDEASFKLREKKVIITSINIVKGQKIKSKVAIINISSRQHGKNYRHYGFM